MYGIIVTRHLGSESGRRMSFISFCRSGVVEKKDASSRKTVTG